MSTEPEKSKKEKKSLSNMDLRNKIITKYRTAHEQEYEKLKSKVKTVKDKDTIKNALSHKERSLSITSISSNDSILSDSNHKKKHKKKNSSSSSSSSSSSDSDDNKDQKSKKNNAAAPPQNQPGGPMFPQGMYNPETGEWMGMGMYPFPFHYAPGMMGPMRPYYGNSYRGGPNRFPRGSSYRGRGIRGKFRGRGGYYSNSYGDNKYVYFFILVS